MKKMINITLISASALLVMQGLSVQAAEKKQEITSDATISAIAGTKPVDPVNPENPKEPGEEPGTNQEGPLQINHVSSLNFGKDIEITPKKVVANEKSGKTPFFQVSDLRGTGDGWALRAKLSDFEKNDDSKKPIKAATITFNNQVIKTSNDTEENKPEGVSTITLNAGGSKEIFMKALKENGRGTWLATYPKVEEESDNQNVVFSAPTASIDANSEYKATITWELFDGPEPEA